MKLQYFLMAALAINLSVRTAAAQQSDEPLPASVGIVLDTSGSMSFKLSQARQIVAAVMNSATPSDEFAVIQAADRPVALSGFVGASSVLPALRFIQPKGRSALLDGIYLGTQLMKMAHNERKVLLVISDGLDNASRYQETEIINALSETGVRVYTMGVNKPTEIPELLQRIADRGHGRTFGVDNVNRLPQAALELTAAMRTQP